jgi:hypothetical protein
MAVKFGVTKPVVRRIRQGKGYRDIYKLWLDSKTEVSSRPGVIDSDNQRQTGHPQLGFHLTQQFRRS